MVTSVLLNNIDHRDLKVITERGAAYGDGVSYALTFPAEFRSIQAHYPIVFGKSAEGQFQPLALLGFQPGENLFLGPDGWDAAYVPLTIARQPFLIGTGREMMVHVDLDSPRISRTRGEALFREHGGTTEFLDQVTSRLRTIHHGLMGTGPFIGALLEHDLIESFVFDVQVAGGATHRLAGFYTIHEERLANLRVGALESLHRAGHLQAIYMIVASVAQLPLLAARQNRRNARDQ
jgi:SapC